MSKSRKNKEVMNISANPEDRTDPTMPMGENGNVLIDPIEDEVPLLDIEFDAPDALMITEDGDLVRESELSDEELEDVLDEMLPDDRKAFEEDHQAEMDAIDEAEARKAEKQMATKISNVDKPERVKQVADNTLPAIKDLQLPVFSTKSEKIRWLTAAGYTRSQIAEHMQLRYQHVRNIQLQVPKKGMPSMPPVVLVMKEAPTLAEEAISQMEEEAELQQLGVDPNRVGVIAA